MFWLVVAVVVLLLGALAWRWSGRAKPGVPPGRQGSTIEDDHVARSQGPHTTGII